jgi:hypothetical protein
LGCGNHAAKENYQMTDTTTSQAPAAKREAIAVRDWIDENGKPLVGGQEAQAVGFRYIHLPTAKKLNPAYNPETDGAPTGSFFDYVCGNVGEAGTMLAIFGGLTLAGNIVNSATNGAKGDPNVNPIPLIEERFKEIDSGVWADRATGVGGVRYDKEKLAAAISQAKGETDPAPYLAKMDNKVDPKSGATVAADTKGAISYGAYALRNAKVKAAYDALAGTGTSIESL